MARLIVCYDELDALWVVPPDSRVKMASLDLPEGLNGRDIYEIARKLAELLLEQVSD